MLHSGYGERTFCNRYNTLLLLPRCEDQHLPPCQHANRMLEYRQSTTIVSSLVIQCWPSLAADQSPPDLPRTWANPNQPDRTQPNTISISWLTPSQRTVGVALRHISSGPPKNGRIEPWMIWLAFARGKYNHTSLNSVYRVPTICRCACSFDQSVKGLPEERRA